MEGGSDMQDCLQLGDLLSRFAWETGRLEISLLEPSGLENIDYSSSPLFAL
jgi:hypothetical protein